MNEGDLKNMVYVKRASQDKPLITIVTVVYNGVKYLENTILSIVNQTYNNIEYIIIDGGSTDGTLEIIRKYDKAISYWVSESDGGISDAFNKAIKVSTGSYINFQGDGDQFYNNAVVENIVEGVDVDNDILISGKIIRTDEVGNTLYISKQSKYFSKKSLLFKMSLPHQGLFTHRYFFEKYGLFDVHNKYCMDYEYLLRAYKNFPKVMLKNIIVSKWRSDGVGNGRILDVLKEYNEIKKKNYISNNLVLNFVHFWSLFKYFFKRLLNYGNH